MWELDSVPDHYRAEAAVILIAREQAAIERINRLTNQGKSPVAPAIDMDILLGEM